MIFDLLFLTYFILYDSLWVHTHLCKWHNSISFHSWIIFCYIYVPHLLYSHSVDGHLGCSHVLAILNSATVNIVVCVSFWIELWFFLRVALLGHMVHLSLIRLNISICINSLFLCHCLFFLYVSFCLPSLTYY